MSTSLCPVIYDNIHDRCTFLISVSEIVSPPQKKCQPIWTLAILCLDGQSQNFNKIWQLSPLPPNAGRKELRIDRPAWRPKSKCFRWLVRDKDINNRTRFGLSSCTRTHVYTCNVPGRYARESPNMTIPDEENRRQCQRQNVNVKKGWTRW